MILIRILFDEYYSKVYNKILSIVNIHLYFYMNGTIKYLNGTSNIWLDLAAVFDSKNILVFSWYLNPVNTLNY